MKARRGRAASSGVWASLTPFPRSRPEAGRGCRSGVAMRSSAENGRRALCRRDVHGRTRPRRRSVIVVEGAWDGLVVCQRRSDSDVSSSADHGRITVGPARQAWQHVRCRRGTAEGNPRCDAQRTCIWTTKDELPEGPRIERQRSRAGIVGHRPRILLICEPPQPCGPPGGLQWPRRKTPPHHEAYRGRRWLSAKDCRDPGSAEASSFDTLDLNER